MKKGDILEGKIERLDFPNKGLLHVEEQTVVVKNALPGQTVRFAVNKKRHGKCEGRLLEVLSRADGEKTDSICPHFGACGGCLFQNLTYETQLEIKQGQVKRLLDEVCDPDSYVFEGIKGSPIEHEYRNKMEFSFGDAYKDGPLALGMHRRDSFYDIVTTDQCKIVHPDFCRILELTLNFFDALGVGYLHKLSHTGYLRHLLVRRAVKTGEILVALVTSGQVEVLPQNDADAWDAPLTAEEMKEQETLMLREWCGELKLLQKTGQLAGSFAGILHIRNDSPADVVKSDETTVLFGQDYFYEELLGLKFRISPFSFFQTNSLGAEVLYETARGYVGETKDKVVFDLYSGTGTIAQIVAPVASKVVGVEIVEEAVETARENAAANGLSNCEFIAGDVLKVIDGLIDKPDLIILDPPRDGIHPKALDRIIDFGVGRMVYISCKPTSLARDLVVLQERGYAVERVCCVDMFPGSGNVETVCLLSKLKSTQHIEVELDTDDLDLTDAEKKATYQEIKDYVLEHTGLKVSSLYIAQVKQKCGIIERENYNKPKSEDAKQPQCPVDKEKAIKEALKHFGMI